MSDKQTTALVLAFFVAFVLWLNTTGRLPFILANIKGLGPDTPGEPLPMPGQDNPRQFPTVPTLPSVGAVRIPTPAGQNSTGMFGEPLVNNPAWSDRWGLTRLGLTA